MEYPLEAIVSYVAWKDPTSMLDQYPASAAVAAELDRTTRPNTVSNSLSTTKSVLSLMFVLLAAFAVPLSLSYHARVLTATASSIHAG